jgi:hypothetical protein
LSEAMAGTFPVTWIKKVARAAPATI